VITPDRVNYCSFDTAPLLACSSEAVRAASADPHVSSDDAVVCGNATRYHQFSVWADDVLETAIFVEETVAVVVADDDAVVVNARQLGVVVHDFSVIQARKTPVAIDISVRNSAAVSGVEVRTNHYAIVIEAIRSSLFCARKVRHGVECTIAVTLEDVTISIAVSINSQKRIQIIDSNQPCAVVRGFRVHDQRCG
jgi:hypothetical protein